MDQRGKFSDTMAKKVNGRASGLYKHAISYFNVHQCSSQSIFIPSFFNIVLNVVEIFNIVLDRFAFSFLSRSCFAFIDNLIEVLWQKKLPL